ncbi:hypothetical protein M2282_000633 [Variovorax boronicumulans]|nr:hypothetical protein [Variovorax boronicumulans]
MPTSRRAEPGACSLLDADRRNVAARKEEPMEEFGISA